ncbi:hypothetical protein L6258_01105, partial [Candidatus Parcubacteria bacterium]|nr:hypothetical protein [Candidatus Parcubacteria bacterium]
TPVPTSTSDPTATVTPRPTGTGIPSPTLSATVTSIPSAIPTATPVDLVISNLWVKSGRDYRVQQLTVGDRCYTDRSYRVLGISANLEGLTWIMTANNDKGARAATFLAFDLSVRAWVFVAYDARAKALPAWLRSFTPVGGEIGVTGGGASRLAIYGREFPAGRVTLGGNQADGFAGVNANYVVLLRASW